MASADVFRQIMLAFPEAEEMSHFGQPDFRVRNKIFGGLSTDGKRATLKLALDVQVSVLSLAPAAFSPCAGAWGRSGWTYIELSGVERGMLQELAEEAFRLIAPHVLVQSLSATQKSKKKHASVPKVKIQQVFTPQVKGSQSAPRKTLQSPRVKNRQAGKLEVMKRQPSSRLRRAAKSSR